MNSADSSCPTSHSLSQDNGLHPDFSWNALLTDPRGNWHIWGWLLCLLCLVITWIISIGTVINHFRNYYEPKIQRHKARVLLYPPCYSTLAWVSYLRYDYATTIMFLASISEAFAVYSFYTCLQAYLQPYRDEAEGVKEEIYPAVIPYVSIPYANIHVKSKWGMHYRIITDILVYQFPLWAVIDAFISIFTELKGFYCADTFSFIGAHVYLTIINFGALSLIISALFVYLEVYKQEWEQAGISSHGLFWCVKLPIMINFYIGTLLLSGLAYEGVIRGTNGSDSNKELMWSTEAVRNGLEVIVVCVVMTVSMGLMAKYYGPQDSKARGISSQPSLPSTSRYYYNNNSNLHKHEKLSFGAAIDDAYINFIPEFFWNVIYCGKESSRLVRKRVWMRQQKKMEITNVIPIVDRKTH